jgi:hypothetical protein
VFFFGFSSSFVPSSPPPPPPPPTTRPGWGEEARPVKVESLSGGRVRLVFEPVAPTAAQEVMEREEAQAVLTVFHAAFLAERPEIRVVVPPTRLSLLEGERWQEQVRGRFQERFEAGELPLPGNLALACLRLYREAEAARSEEELEAAAERFGKAVGGTALRVLVLVASFGVGKSLPSVPHGGLGALLGPPRYAVEGGLAVGGAATARVVADGSLVLSGVATGEVATRLCGGLAMCATSDEAGRAASNGGELLTRYGPPHTRQNPRHNNTIERELASREAAGHTDLLKDKPQINSQGARVYDDAPVDGISFRKPDIASTRPDGVRHNTNYVSDPAHLKRELTAFEALIRADKKAIHELYLLDGTLIRRYVPQGFRYP